MEFVVDYFIGQINLYIRNKLYSYLHITLWSLSQMIFTNISYVVYVFLETYLFFQSDRFY